MRLFACVIMCLVACPRVYALRVDDRLLSYSLEELLQLKVTTSSRIEQSLDETPGMMLVVTRKQIQARGYRSLMDLLKDLPAMEVQHYSNSEHNARISARGLTGRIANDQFVVLLDGHLINDPAAAPMSIAENFPLYMVKQVEVAYGPYSSQYGADAVAGVINLISAEGGGAYTDLRLEAGEHDYGYFSGFTHGHCKDMSYSFGAHAHQSNDDSRVQQFPDAFQLHDLLTFAGDVVVSAEDRAPFRYPVKSRTLFGKISRKQGELGFWHSDYQVPTWGSQTADVVDYAVDAFWQYAVSTLWLEQQWSVSKPLSFKFSSDYARGEVDPSSYFVNSFSDFEKGYKYQLSEATKAQGEVYFQTKSYDLIAGLQWKQSNVIARTTDLAQPFDRRRSLGLQNIYYPGTDETLPVKIFDSRYRNQAIFGEWISRWTNKMTTQVGLRYENSDNWGDALTPRLALSFQANDALALKALYGEAFRSPSPHISYSHFGAFSGEQNEEGDYLSGFFRIPNENLKPELSKSFELSLRHALLANLHWTATVYRTKIDDLVRPTITNPTQSDYINGGYIYATQTLANLDSITSEGLSATLHYQRLFNGQYSVDLWSSFDYNRGELNDNTRGTTISLPLIHRKALKIGAEWRLGTNWQFTPVIRWFDAALSDSTDPENPRYGRRAPGYTVVNLYLARERLWRQSEVYLRANNIFNKAYVQIGDVVEEEFLFSPQSGRSVQLGLKYQW